jgi:hypothetical protein
VVAEIALVVGSFSFTDTFSTEFVRAARDTQVAAA